MIEPIHDFITADETLTLQAAIREKRKRGELKANSAGPHRYFFVATEDTNYGGIAMLADIRARIVSRLDLHGYKLDPLWQNFVSMFDDGAFVHQHTDSALIPGTEHVRVNVVINLPETGGHSFCSEKVTLRERDLWGIVASRDLHWTDVNIGTRMIYSCGFAIPREDVIERGW